MRIKRFNLRQPFVDNSSIEVEEPCRCLGSRIADQMFHGVDSSISTLCSGEYDDDDNWDVDPACDMSTDRFSLEFKEPVPVVPTASVE